MATTNEVDVLVQRATAALAELAKVRDALVAVVTPNAGARVAAAALLGFAVGPGGFASVAVVLALWDGLALPQREATLNLAASLDRIVSTSGPNLVARIRAGELDRYDSLRTLLANAAAVGNEHVRDVGSSTGINFSSFFREVLAESAADLVTFVRELPERVADVLPKVGIGVAGIGIGLGFLWLALRR